MTVKFYADAGKAPLVKELSRRCAAWLRIYLHRFFRTYRGNKGQHVAGNPPSRHKCRATSFIKGGFLFVKRCSEKTRHRLFHKTMIPSKTHSLTRCNGKHDRIIWQSAFGQVRLPSSVTAPPSTSIKTPFILVPRHLPLGGRLPCGIKILPSQKDKSYFFDTQQRWFL